MTSTVWRGRRPAIRLSELIVRGDVAAGVHGGALAACGFVALLLSLRVSAVAVVLRAGRGPEAEDATGPAAYAPTGTRHGAGC
jgi:energy-converting hydrogenase Eha subunit G